MAVRPFKGMSQTPMYAHARRLLLRFVQKVRSLGPCS